MSTFNVYVDETVSKVIVDEDTQSLIVQHVGIQGPAGGGVPTGGTTGQVLAKASNFDLDTEWVNQTGGGVTDHTLLTNIGVNSHAKIDTHMAATNNPHVVTKAQVGLGNVVNADTTTTANITDSTNKRFVTDAQQTVLVNTSGTNTGDQTNVSGYSEALKTATTTVVVSASAAPTSGQVLTATSSTAATWQTPSGGGGSGLTNLNGLTSDPQSFATGTSGTDFAISSATSTHTFNLPIASASNTGKLSSTDWSTFNNKQASLGFTAENVANKATDFTTINNTKYPTTQAVSNLLASSALSGGIYIFSSVNSDLAGYESAPAINDFVASGLATVTQTVTTSATLMEEFSTPSSGLGITVLPAGLFTVHYDAQKSSGSNNYFTYAEIYKRTSGGTETLIATTDVSPSIALNTNQSITVTALSSTSTAMNLTDRIVTKIYFQMVTGSQSISLKYDDATSARVQLPSSSLAFTPENISNKATDGTLAADSDFLYPSQKAVKTYVDTGLATKGNAQTANPLSQFAATTSAQLAGVIIDETGSGALVFGTAPSLTDITTDRVTVSGNISAPAWTTNGLRIKGVASTLTDTTSSGTVAAAYTNALGGNTIAATSSTTFTNYITAFYKEPTSGTNVTFTNKWALGAESLRVGTSNQLTISASGVLTAIAPSLGTPTALVGTNITGTASGLTSGITNALKSATTTVDVSAATAPTSGQVLTATGSSAATWQTPAGSGYNITTVTTTSSSPSDTTGERIILCDAATAGGNITINLPTAVSNLAKFTIKKIDSGTNKIIVDPNSTQTVDGLTTWELFSQQDSIMIISDNSNWRIIA